MNINEILSTISCLPEEEQYFIADTLNKRISDLRRSQIETRGKQAEENYEQDNVKSVIAVPSYIRTFSIPLP